MIKYKNISVFEHQRLYVGEKGFQQKHLDSLLKLNELHEGKYFEPISKGVKFNQYVGIIQFNNICIEIHPKADKNDDDNKLRGVLIKMLKACGKLKVDANEDAHVKKQNLSLLEIYFEKYLLEVESLIRRGLIKRYRNETKNTKALKGKLEFAGHIQKNIVHKERFFTTHQVYDSDHFLHQTLYKAITIVDQFTKGTHLYDLTKRVSLNFPSVSEKQFSLQKLNSLKVNRKSIPYKDALDLARLIILNYSPDISSGKEKMLSLLFDMNDLWESYVLKRLQVVSENTDIEISGQETKHFWGSNTLRPDIVLRKGNETIIIDTKWKTPKNNSPSIGDLRQMYTYSRFWNASKSMLLYPGSFGDINFKTFLTDDYYKTNDSELQEIDHQCKLGYISVINENGKLQPIGASILDMVGLNLL